MNLKDEIIIQVHNGKFHADDAASVAILAAFFAHRGKKIQIIRSREINNTADIYVDVGLEYNAELGKFDHHQPNFMEIWNTDPKNEKLYGDKKKVPLSAIGLIWRHFGTEIVNMYLSENIDNYNTHEDCGHNYTEETTEDIKNLIYYNLFYDIDAEDNGIITENKNLNISDLITSLNSVGDNNTAFTKAIELLGEIFDIKFRSIINNYFNMKKDMEMVRKYYENAENQYLVVYEHIPTFLKCLDILDKEYNIKFVIFCHRENEEYTIKTRSLSGNKFQPICPIIPELSKDILDNVIFLHKAQFLAKTKNLATAIQIVQASLNYALALKQYNSVTILQPNKERSDFSKEIAEMLYRVEPISESNIFNRNTLILGLSCVGLLFYMFKYKSE